MYVCVYLFCFVCYINISLTAVQGFFYFYEKDLKKKKIHRNCHQPTSDHLTLTDVVFHCFFDAAASVAAAAASAADAAVDADDDDDEVP